MKLHRIIILAALIAGLGVAGCASAPGSPTQQGAVTGAAVGAITGQAIGEDTEGTLLGAAVGAAAGALIGEQVENRREAAAADTAREETIRRQEAEIEQLRREKAAAAARPEAGEVVSTAEPTRTVAKLADPTKGELINNTGWLVEVFIDSSDLQRAPDVTLNPYERISETLDVGTHRIYAIAYAQTSRGLRIVGELDEVIEVDVRGRGWNFTLTEASF